MDTADKLHESVRILEHLDEITVQEGKPAADAKKPAPKKSLLSVFGWGVLILSVCLIFGPILVALLPWVLLILMLLFELLTTGQIRMSGKGVVFSLF